MEVQGLGIAAGRQLKTLGSPGGFWDQTNRSSVSKIHAVVSYVERIHTSAQTSRCVRYTLLKQDNLEQLSTEDKPELCQVWSDQSQRVSKHVI